MIKKYIGAIVSRNGIFTKAATKQRTLSHKS